MQTSEYVRGQNTVVATTAISSISKVTAKFDTCAEPTIQRLVRLLDLDNTSITSAIAVALKGTTTQICCCLTLVLSLSLARSLARSLFGSHDLMNRVEY
jgi:hypothetical protein